MNTKSKTESVEEPPPRKSSERILRQPAVTAMVGIQPTCQFELEKAGEFPKRFAITPRAAGWLESEILAWIEKRAADRRALPRPAEPLPDKRTRSNATRRVKAHG